MNKVDRSTQPEIRNIENINYLKPTEIILDNGVKLNYIKGGSSDFVQIFFVFNAGLAYTNHKLLSLMSNMLFKESYKGIKPDDFSEKLDFYGCILSGHISTKYAGLKLLVPNKHAEKVIPMIAKLIKTPGLPKKEYEILQKNYYRKIQYNQEKTRFLALKAINTSLFGEKNPFGLRITPEDVYGVNLDDIGSFVNNHYTSTNLNILLAGNFDNNIIKLLNRNIGNEQWGNCTYKAFKNYPIEVAKDKKTVIKRENALQSSIFLGKFINIDKPNEIHNVNILNTILGAYFGSRLMKNIREDKGYTYGIGSFLTKYLDRNVLRITADVGVSYTNDTIKEIFNECEKLINTEIEDNELALVKNYMMGDLLNSFNGPYASISTFLNLYESNVDSIFIDNQVKAIKSISKEDLISYAKKHLDPKSFHIVIAGSEG